MRDPRGSLPLVDALAFLAVISLASALLLSAQPPVEDARVGAERYAAAALRAILETTLERPVLWVDHAPEVLDPGPVSEVLTEALHRDLDEEVNPGFLQASVFALTHRLIREDWGYHLGAVARRGGDHASFHVGERFPGTAEYATATLLVGLEDGTRVVFRLDVAP